MKNILIPKIAIENRHPKGVKSTSDMEYARIATEIATEMARLKVPDISEDGLKLLAVSVALYFEDVVADAGMWRGFTDMMKERHGSYLPFFSVDEGDYYQDEPNLVDVRFIVWYTMLHVHQGRVCNPESPTLTQLAEVAYGVLDRHFETVSVNEALKDFFAHPQFISDFYHQRSMLEWFCFGCYLTYCPQLPDRMFAQAQQMAQQMNGNINMALYLAECLTVYNQKVGPLRLLPQEWLAATLRANGNDEAADIVGKQVYREYLGYKIVSAEPGKDYVFEDFKGGKFSVSREELHAPEEEGDGITLIVGSFVQYDGEWRLNGTSAWGRDLAPFKDAKADYASRKNLKKAYEELRDNAAMYYFADNKELEAFLLDKLPFDDKLKKNFKLPENKNIALYLPADYHEDFMILPDAALCLKDESNPYYIQKMAVNQALNLALSLKDEVCDYVIAHHLLPDATINSSDGLKRGNEIVQQNFSVLVSAVKSRL